MNEKEKQEYLESYHQAKEKGVPFFPDVLFKDAVVSLLVFLVLIGLAYFAGAPLEARANPADTSYTPRPEWYFLFLFQLLKYFPGNLEVVGVVVIPTLAILLLFLLPFLDRSAHRHISARKPILAGTVVGLVAVIALSIQSIRETPPPAEAARGDQTAALYARNCAGCHGPSITVASGTNLHDVIAKGRHEGMPAWSADLTTDQIDALVGFILSPGGSKLFTQQCGKCHEAPELVAGKPLELKNALELGPDYPSHATLTVPVWTDVLSQQERTALLNFLVAPDGQRLYAINCLPCHGSAVAFSGDENQLRDIISKGGMHLEMPPWKEKLSGVELDTLARYVVDPKSAPEGQNSFQQYCSNCHGERIPVATDVTQARETIASGGAHQTMPVWGSILTTEQLNALVSYTLEATQGNPLEQGQQLFAKNCSPCHGQFGEGGPNPTRPNDIIAPISTAEYLKTRDDYTFRQIIAQGQPNFGMSPFGISFGGPLDEEEIDAIVTYLRSLEISPPVELPTEVASSPLSEKGPEIFKSLCAQCHGLDGQGGVGPALSDTKFQAANTDQDIFNTIDQGHKASSMIAWGEILSSDQITELVKYIRQFKPTTTTAPAATPTAPTFADVMKLFDSYCSVCHGDQGGWDATSYQSIMTTGEHQPVVIPGDTKNSLLAQKLLNTQTVGGIMPPFRKMSSAEIQIILDWITAGAPEK